MACQHGDSNHVIHNFSNPFIASVHELPTQHKGESHACAILNDFAYVRITERGTQNHRELGLLSFSVDSLQWCLQEHESRQMHAPHNQNQKPGDRWERESSPFHRGHTLCVQSRCNTTCGCLRSDNNPMLVNNCCVLGCILKRLWHILPKAIRQFAKLLKRTSLAAGP
jgi:hypothetical protein